MINKRQIDCIGRGVVKGNNPNLLREVGGDLAVSPSAQFLPMQLIYAGKTDRCLPKFDFLKGFDATFSENHWFNSELQIFKIIIIPNLEKVKKEKAMPKEQMSLIIMDTFSGQDNETIWKFCISIIVPHNLTNRFQPLDISVNKLSKSFLSKEYNQWFSDNVAANLLM